MSRRKIAAGPGASSLILIAVVLALSVLTALTMISARNDEALSLRSEETQEEVYELFARGERSLAGLDAVLVKAGQDAEDMDEYLEEVQEDLPEGMTLREDRVYWMEKTENRALECAVQLLPPGGGERTRWTLHRLGSGDLWTEEEEPETAETEAAPDTEDEDADDGDEEDDELDLDLEG